MRTIVKTVEQMQKETLNEWGYPGSHWRFIGYCNKAKAALYALREEEE